MVFPANVGGGVTDVYSGDFFPLSGRQIIFGIFEPATRHAHPPTHRDLGAASVSVLCSPLSHECSIPVTATLHGRQRYLSE